MPHSSRGLRGIGGIPRMANVFHGSGLYYAYKSIAAPGEYFWWRLRGSRSLRIPHLVKQRAVAQFAREFDLHILVETGTHFGQMLNAQKNLFREIHSIEMDSWKVRLAKKRFARCQNIRIYEGDSAKVLPEVITKIKEPCLFWLDAHDGDRSSPIRAELDCIYKHPVAGHVMLIDDAPCFDGRTDYPKVEELQRQAAAEYPGCVAEVKEGIIRIYRPKA